MTVVGYGTDDDDDDNEIQDCTGTHRPPPPIQLAIDTHQRLGQQGAQVASDDRGPLLRHGWVHAAPTAAPQERPQGRRGRGERGHLLGVAGGPGQGGAGAQADVEGAHGRPALDVLVLGGIGGGGGFDQLIGRSIDLAIGCVYVCRSRSGSGTAAHYHLS
jgi:hypothetical protein